MSASLSRRGFLASLAAGTMVGAARLSSSQAERKALLAITLDLEMSAEYPTRGMTEWNFRKGELDDATKQYALQAGKIAKERGGCIHYFALGRTLEQADIGWLKELAAMGHAIGNHTYDHVNVWSTKPDDVQFRFKRAPWLIQDRPVPEVIEENIALTTQALRQRCDIAPNGFRTPGGSNLGLRQRPDIQKMLLRQGFSWVSSLYPSHLSGTAKIEPTDAVYADIVRAQSQAQPFRYESGLIEVPMSPISDVTAFRSHYWKLEWFLKAVRLAAEQAIRTGGVFDFLAHPSCLVVEDPTFEIVKLICDLARQAGDRAEITTLDRFAERGKDVPDPKSR